MVKNSVKLLWKAAGIKTWHRTAFTGQQASKLKGMTQRGSGLKGWCLLSARYVLGSVPGVRV